LYVVALGGGIRYKEQEVSTCFYFLDLLINPTKNSVCKNVQIIHWLEFVVVVDIAYSQDKQASIACS